MSVSTWPNISDNDLISNGRALWSEYNPRNLLLQVFCDQRSVLKLWFHLSINLDPLHVFLTSTPSRYTRHMCTTLRNRHLSFILKVSCWVFHLALSVIVPLLHHPYHLLLYLVRDRGLLNHLNVYDMLTGPSACISSRSSILLCHVNHGRTSKDSLAANAPGFIENIWPILLSTWQV